MSAYPDQMPLSATFDQVIHCLLTEYCIKIVNKNEKYNQTTIKFKIDSSN